MKILFLLKKNLIYGSYNSVIAKSGLLNSARITSSQLEKHLRVKTDIEICVDGNEVDKFLHKHKPNLCVIEALWVTPEKLEELTRLHRKIIFVVLIHSEVPFLANEGNAIEWIKKYNAIDRVYPSFNSKRTFEQFHSLGIADLYLPNIYLDVAKKERGNIDGKLNVGCFGAIRPFKNQLIQAMAAMIFANNLGVGLRFHMNTSRTEQGGQSALKNIKALFDGSKHKLIEHGWKERDAFLCLVNKMDIGMQISFSESFNIVTADFVHENVPVVVSPTIEWMPDSQKVDTEDMDAIVALMEYSLSHSRQIIKKSLKALNTYNDDALNAWSRVLKKIQ